MIQWLVQLLQKVLIRTDFLSEGVRLVIGMLRMSLDNQQKIMQLEQQNREANIAMAEEIMSIAASVADTNKVVHEILAGQTFRPPVKFTVTLIPIGGNMATVKASLDFQLLDNGTAKAVATPDDAAGLPAQLPAGVTASWASSDPGVVVTADASDPTGLTAIVAPANPPVLVTGAKVSVSATLPDGTVITGSSEGIDVVGGAAAGFKVQLS